MIQTYWKTFCRVLLGMLERPMWMMLLLSLCLMSLVYANRTVWDLPVAVIDQDHTPASRALIRNLNATSKINVVMYDNLPEAQHDLGWRKLFAVIIMPVNLEKKILHGQSVVIPVYGDATSRLANGQIQQDVQNAYQILLNEYNTSILLKQGFTPAQISVVLTPVKGQILDLFNPGTSFAAIVFPGLLVMLLQHSLLIACVRVGVTMRINMKGKIPLPVYLGGLSALIPIWLFLSIVMFVLWPWVLGYRQTAPIPTILLLTFPFLLAVIGVGKLLTECLRKIELIYLTLTFMTTPVFYLSGTMWPLQAMPGWVRAISYCIPSTWATKAIAGVNQLGLSITDVWFDVLMMLILGAVYALLGIGLAILHDSQRLRSLFPRKNALSDNKPTENA